MQPKPIVNIARTVHSTGLKLKYYRSIHGRRSMGGLGHMSP